MIIDERGRLFGLINLLDLVLLIGVVIVLYFGATVYLVSKKPALTMQSLDPKQMTVGETPQFTLKLVNDRRLSSAKVKLIPKGFEGPVVVQEGRTDKRKRDVVLFSMPAAVQPGEYQIELEVTTLGFFSREHLYTTRASEQVLTVNPKPVVAPPAPPKVEIRGKYFWPVELEVFFPPGQQKAFAGLRPGAEVAEAGAGFTAKVLSVRASLSSDTLSLSGRPWWKKSVPFRGGRVAGGRAQVDYVDLPSFQQKVLSPGARMDLRRGKEKLTGYLLGMVAVEPQIPEDLVSWEVTVAMLSLNESQRQALVVNAQQVDTATGLVMAQVIQIVRGPVNSWIKVVPPKDPGKIAPRSSPFNIIARMKLLCELKNGRVYFGGVPLEPGAMLNFEMNGRKMAGTMLSAEKELIPLNVYFPMVPRQVAARLRKGMQVFRPGGTESMATIREILDSKPATLPFDLGSDAGTDLTGKYNHLLLRLELYCSVTEQGLVSSKQKIQYGGPLKVQLLSEQLTGTITIRDELPPPGKFYWKEDIMPVVFNVFFPVVPGKLAERIHDGMVVYAPGAAEPLGTIQQLIGSEAVKPPYGLKAGDRVDLSEDYKRFLVRMEIYCSPDRDGLTAAGQRIDYGSPLNVLLFSESLRGTITNLDSLPPQFELGWQEIEVVFSNLTPPVAELIREGVVNAVENEPATMVIEKIISNEPAKQHIALMADGTLNIGEHPDNRDIRCRLRIMAYRSGEKLFYRGTQLFLSGEIKFITDRWQAAGKVVDF